MIETRVLTGADLDAALDDVAALRIRVFRDWPYLYDGDVAYERRYLETYRTSPGAVLVGAFEGDRLVGAATGTPLAEHADEFAEAFEATDIEISSVFYCAESVLLAGYRGQGIGHRFFDLREAHAKALGFDRSAFCAVIRPANHPLKLKSYRPLDGFWQARGYRPLPGVVAKFGWKDLDAKEETFKPMQFWLKSGL